MSRLFVAIFIIFVCTFWIFWLPGPRVATDYYLSTEEIINDYSYPWVWRENTFDGLGEYVVSTLWSQPIHVFFKLLINLGVSVIWVTKVLFALILLIGLFSILRLLTYLNINNLSKMAGAVFYLSNTFFLLLVDGGQLSLALAYAIVPLSVYAYFKLIDFFNLKSLLYFTLSLIIISFIDIRFIFILFLFFFIHLLFNIGILPFKKAVLILKSVLKTFSFSGVVLLFVHAYWIIPSIIARGVQLPQTYERVSQVDFLSWSSIAHSIFLQQPHWYKNIFGVIFPISSTFSLIPVLVFSTVFLARKNKTVGLFLLVALIGIFLSKGSQSPFGFIYNWLFVYIPGFSIFRDPVKFYLYIALSYSVLIAIALDKISELNLRNEIPRSKADAVFWFKNKIVNGVIKVLPIFIIIYFILLMWPVYTGKMTGLFSVPRYEKEYIKQRQIFTKDRNFSRIFWLPTQSSLGYTSLNHPAVSASELVKKRPFAVGVKGTYETFNFLREASFVGELFDVAGIGYINYPYLDPKRSELSADNIKYYYSFLDQLSSLNWLSRVSDSPMPLLKVNKHQDRFFTTSNVRWVIGSDSSYNESTKSASLSLSENALIFAEQLAGLGKELDRIPQAQIVLNHKSKLDLAASFIDLSSLIFPARSLNFSPDSSGWWKREASDLIEWRAFLQNKYQIDNQDFDLGGGWAIGEGEKDLTITSRNFKKGKVLLARVMESTRSGELSFYQGSSIVGKINTKSFGNDMKWLEVGELPNETSSVKIASSGEINIVNAISVLDKSEWLNFQDKAENLMSRVKRYDDLNQVLSPEPEIFYKKINPTKYLVNIKGLKNETFLVFSQNYDPLWKMDGQSAVPVFSLLNGFVVKKDGQYTIEFEAQKYADFGLIIAIVAVLVYLILLIKYGRNNR